ncbi:hypothetical protein DERP_013251 [Dermatophagoides pteronyssinus]|uniref:Uncharacterized protein n=1 Tax=Dermatophagoides pteronyssinus TaxID=6956 RepID=A0ABQ8IRI9_DERPT|nr:hypothetical protein DERP_013251 [Dermatophagoides pteronyssinus]
MAIRIYQQHLKMFKIRIETSSLFALIITMFEFSRTSRSAPLNISSKFSSCTVQFHTVPSSYTVVCYSFCKILIQ